VKELLKKFDNAINRAEHRLMTISRKIAITCLPLALLFFMITCLLQDGELKKAFLQAFGISLVLGVFGLQFWFLYKFELWAREKFFPKKPDKK